MFNARLSGPSIRLRGFLFRGKCKVSAVQMEAIRAVS